LPENSLINSAAFDSKKKNGNNEKANIMRLRDINK
jgi:hypothetical protein